MESLILVCHRQNHFYEREAIILTGLSLVFKNIKKFIQHKPFLFAFLVISQIVCVIVVFLVCGFVDNANRAENIISEGSKEFYIALILNNSDEANNYFLGEDGKYYQEDEDGNLIPYDENTPNFEYTEDSDFEVLKPKIDELIKFLGDDFSSFFLFATTNKVDGSYFRTGYSDINSYDNEDEKNFEMSNEKIVKINPEDNYYIEKYGKSLNIGDKIDINGEKYTIAKHSSGDVMSIPYNSVDKYSLATGMHVFTKEACSPKRCEEITAKMKELFGDEKEFSPPEPRVLDEVQNIQLAYGITAAVIIMIILNISRVYSYVLTYRKKTFAIMNICGASKRKIFLIYLVELMLTLIVTFGIALLIFHTLILQPIAVSYHNFLISMTLQTYLIIFGIYFVIAVLIMSLTISRFISKSAVEMERSGD